MATKFVNSGAAGANNGTSWTDAWTSLASADGGGTVAGDEVRVHKTHSENFTAGTTLSFAGTAANPVKIFCVDKDAADALSTGAAINQTTLGALAITGDVFCDGLTITSNINNILDLTSGTGDLQTFQNCTFIHTGNGTSAIMRVTGSRATIRFINCTIDFSGVGNIGTTFSVIGFGTVFDMRGGAIICRSAGAMTTLFVVSTNGSQVRLEGVAITNTVTNIGSITGGTLKMKQCSLPTFTNLIVATPTDPESNTWAELEACVSGTITVPPLGLQWRHDRTGQIKSTLARFRTGGADDGYQANAHSWELVSNTGALDQYVPLAAPLLTRMVTSGAKTVTIFIAGGATLQDDEFWVELVSPSEAGSANSQGRFQTSRLPTRGTPANLTTDGTSAWNGSGVGTKQKVAFSINPTVAGLLSARCCLAKPSTTLYVDPRIDVV